MAQTNKPRKPAKRQSALRSQSSRSQPVRREEYEDQVAGDKVGRDKIGRQVNLKDGPYFEGPVNTVHIVQVDPEGNIKWNKVQFTTYLNRLQSEFTRQIQERTDNSKSVVSSVQSAASVYVPPLLSRRRTERGSVKSGVNRTDDQSLQGTWDELVQHPCLGLLIGDNFDGKSLLLRKVAADLAEQALRDKKARLPIYLPLEHFHGSTLDDLLDAAAFACGLDPRVLRALWDDERRPVCLLIDGFDDTAAVLRDQLVTAIANLNQRRKSHSIIVACRPGPVRVTLGETLGSDPLFTELVMLPLDDARIDRLLERYGAQPALAAMIHSDGNLRRLVSKPGLLAGLVRAWKGLPTPGLSTPTPKSLAELYRLLIDEHLFAGDNGAYHYLRAKRPVFAYLAYCMLCKAQNSLPVDEPLYGEIAQLLAAQYQRYDRSAKTMPPDWHASDLLPELLQSPVMNQDAGQRGRLEFVSSVYRDYYAALYLKGVGAGWSKVADEIKSSNLEAWMDALMLLSGMQTPDETNYLLEAVLADRPQLAADLWLEKSAIGLSLPPSCIASDYRSRLVFVPAAPEPHPAQRYLTRLLSQSDPRISLDAVCALSQLGMDAIDPLLDACEATQPVVQANAIHALLHLGESIATAQSGVVPLLQLDGSRLMFNNLGAGNVVIGPLTLVQVPRPFRAELAASIDQFDFDLFSVPLQFLLWHTPAAWFALDYISRAGVRFNWIGLASACSAVARCASLVIQRAAARPALAPLIDELIQCLISYDRLGSRLAADLGLPWKSEPTAGKYEWLLQAADQVYGELRLFFSRANRPRMLSLMNETEQAGPTEGDPLRPISMTAATNQGKVTAVRIENVDLIAGQQSDVPDVPSATRIHYGQVFDKVEGVDFTGISIDRVTANLYLSAETLALRSCVTVQRCSDAQFSGIVIGNLSRPNGIRARLSLTIDQLTNSQVVGIQASLSPETLRKTPSGG